MHKEKNRELFTTWLCDYIRNNFKDNKKDVFVYDVYVEEWFLLNWTSIEGDLEKAISESTGFNFDITFDKKNLELRGRLIKIGGIRNEI